MGPVDFLIIHCRVQTIRTRLRTHKSCRFRSGSLPRFLTLTNSVIFRMHQLLGMHTDLRDQFTARWQQYFPGAELPLPWNSGTNPALHKKSFRRLVIAASSARSGGPEKGRLSSSTRTRSPAAVGSCTQGIQINARPTSGFSFPTARRALSRENDTSGRLRLSMPGKRASYPSLRRGKRWSSPGGTTHR